MIDDLTFAYYEASQEGVASNCIYTSCWELKIVAYIGIPLGLGLSGPNSRRRQLNVLLKSRAIIIAPGSAAVEQGLELKIVTVKEKEETKKRIAKENQCRRTQSRNPNIPDGGRGDSARYWQSLLPDG